MPRFHLSRRQALSSNASQSLGSVTGFAILLITYCFPTLKLINV